MLSLGDSGAGLPRTVGLCSDPNCRAEFYMPDAKQGDPCPMDCDGTLQAFTLAEQVADALEGLYDVYKPEGVGIWLKGAKHSLDGRSPLDLIRAGRVDDLAAMVERMRSGAAT